VTQALALQTRLPNTAGALWARIDHELVDQAPWVPLYNPRSLVVLSTRVGNYQTHPYWTLLIDSYGSDRPVTAPRRSACVRPANHVAAGIG